MRFHKATAAVAAAVIGTTLAACGGPTGTANGEVTLRVNTGVPPTHHLVENVFEPWQEFVEAETDGAVQVEIYNGDTLGTLKSVLSDLSSGVYDAGVVVPTYFQDTQLFPLTIGGLAYAYPDIETGNEVMSAYVEKHKEDISATGVHLVNTSVSDTYALFSKNPIRTNGDLRGMQVKVQSSSDAMLVEQWGATPVQLATSETYQALERGTVDAVPYTLVGDMGAKFHEVAPYVTKFGAWGTLSTPALSQVFLDRLPEDLARQFDQTLLPRLTALNEATYQQELEAATEELPELVDRRGGEVIEPTGKALDDFRRAARPQWDAWIKQADEKGYDGQALVGDWLRLLEQAGAPAPFKP